MQLTRKTPTGENPLTFRTGIRVHIFIPEPVPTLLPASLANHCFRVSRVALLYLFKRLKWVMIRCVLLFNLVSRVKLP